MNVAARVCRSPDSWPCTDHSQISLIHSPTPPKCSTRAIVALINNLGIVYHQYCSSLPSGKTVEGIWLGELSQCPMDPMVAWETKEGEE
jgi:hypothetical protein